jgi:hypothetical protein
MEIDELRKEERKKKVFKGRKKYLLISSLANVYIRMRWWGEWG